MRGSLRSLTNLGTVRSTVVNGLKIGVGYAGVNALRAIEGRFGLDGILARLPGGLATKVAEYALKFVNTSIAASIAGFGGRGFSQQVRAGGFANIGVNLLSDVAGAFGGYGDTVRSYLHGMGDYNLAYNAGQAMGGPFRLGNYNLSDGSQAMVPVSGDSVYPGLESIYG